MKEPILVVEDLVVEIATKHGVVRPVDGVSFTVAAGRTTGLVGESGSGKSLTALAILRLLPPHARVAGGRVVYRGEDVLALDAEALRRLRGDRVAMIFQEPSTALNPVLTVGSQIAEVLRAHRDVTKKDAWAAAVRALADVGVPSPEERARAYPHELSGGLKQRAMIASALVCGPDVLLADEPTTALDPTIQAQILDLLDAKRRALGTGVLLITHDLGVVAESCDDVVVLYAGTVVERAPVLDLFARPVHPYTRGLLDSVPSRARDAATRRLPAIQGGVPSPAALPPGCRFAPRCPRATPACDAALPALASFGAGRDARCIHPLVDEPVAEATP